MTEPENPLLLSVPAFWPVAMAATMLKEGTELYATNCETAWGPYADTHAKPLIRQSVEGSFLDAYSHPVGVQSPTCANGLTKLPR